MSQHKVLLNNVEHIDLSVDLRYGIEFGDNVNQTLVFPTEFEDLQREYPILFRASDTGTFQSIVLLGFDRDENLFLSGNVWDAHYVPALMARGPFSIALQNSVTGEPKPVIHIDLADARVVTNQGTRLFKPHGGNSAYLDRIIETLGKIYDGLDLERRMFSAFTEAELLRPVALDINVSDEERYKLSDLFTIAEDRLASLSGDALARLHEDGFLRAAFMAAASLGNVVHLIDRKRARGLVDCNINRST